MFRFSMMTDLPRKMRYTGNGGQAKVLEDMRAGYDGEVKGWRRRVVDMECGAGMAPRIWRQPIWSAAA